MLTAHRYTYGIFNIIDVYFKDFSLLESSTSKFKFVAKKDSIDIQQSLIVHERVLNTTICSGLTNTTLPNKTEDIFTSNTRYQQYFSEDMPVKTRILTTYFTIFNGTDHRHLSDQGTIRLIRWSFESLLTNNIPPAWSLSLSSVVVHSWARDCEDQAIYAEVVAVFADNIKVSLIEKIMKMITIEPVNMGGVILANFIISSHIKVVPGSVYKAFLTIENIPEEDFENTTVTDLIEESISGLLKDFLSFEFDGANHMGKSVDWSYNITYKAETFKARVLSIRAEFVEVYVLVAPHQDSEKKILSSLEQLINFCMKEYTFTRLLLLARAVGILVGHR